MDNISFIFREDLKNEVLLDGKEPAWNRYKSNDDCGIGWEFQDYLFRLERYAVHYDFLRRERVCKIVFRCDDYYIESDNGKITCYIKEEQKDKIELEMTQSDKTNLASKISYIEWGLKNPAHLYSDFHPDDPAEFYLVCFERTDRINNDGDTIIPSAHAEFQYNSSRAKCIVSCALSFDGVCRSWCEYFRQDRRVIGRWQGKIASVRFYDHDFLHFDHRFTKELGLYVKRLVDGYIELEYETSAKHKKLEDTGFKSILAQKSMSEINRKHYCEIQQQQQNSNQK